MTVQKQGVKLLNIMYQSQTCNIQQCTMLEIPHVYDQEKLIDFYLENIFIINEKFYHIMHSESNFLIFSNNDKFVIVLIFKTQFCYLILQVENAESILELSQYAEQIFASLKDKNELEIQEQVYKEQNIVISHNEFSEKNILNLNFLNKAKSYQNEKYITLIFTKIGTHQFYPDLQLAYQISQSEHLYVAICVQFQSKETFMTINPYFRKLLNFVEDDGRAGEYLKTNNICCITFMKEVHYCKQIGQDKSIEQLCNTIGQVTEKPKLQSLLFINRYILLFGTPMYAERLQTNTQIVIFSFIQNYDEIMLERLQNLGIYYTIYCVSPTKPEQVKQFGLVSGDGMLKQLPKLLQHVNHDDKSQILIFKDGIITNDSIETLEQSIEDQVPIKIVYHEKKLQELFRQFSINEEQIQKNNLIDLLNLLLLNKTYQVRKLLDQFPHIIWYEDFKQLLIDSHFKPYNQNIKPKLKLVKSKVADLIPESQMDKIRHVQERLDQYQLIGSATVANLFNINQSVSKDFYTKEEVKQIIEQFKAQEVNDDSDKDSEKSEKQQVAEPTDISGSLQFTAARQIFTSLAYGMQFCIIDKVIQYFQENKVEIEQIMQFVRAKKVKKFDFPLFWQLIQYLQYDINLRLLQVDKIETETNNREEQDLVIDPYHQLFLKHLFKQYSDQQNITGVHINKLFVDNGVQFRIPNNSWYNYLSFQQFMVQKKFDTLILVKKEKEFMRVLFDSFQKQGLIYCGTIQRCADIEGLDKDLVLSQLQQSSPYVNFEQFYLIMKKSGWQVAW